PARASGGTYQAGPLHPDTEPAALSHRPRFRLFFSADADSATGVSRASACEQPVTAESRAGSRKPGAVRSAGRPAIVRIIQPVDHAISVDGNEAPRPGRPAWRR